MSAAPDLSVELCGVRLPSPLILGSGGLGESADSLATFQGGHCAAVVTRTLRETTPPGRESFPSPHLALGPRRAWLLNCEWGNLRGLDYWIEAGLPEAASRGPVIASVSGRDLDDCQRTCRRLRDTPAVMLELNFSCSHAGQIYGRVLDDPRHVREVVAAVKRVSRVPVIAKLGWSPALVAVARSAERAGADAIAVTNTVGPGLDIDLATRKPRLGIAGGIGGMSGPAIFPIALECVSRVASAVSVPTVGIGGVTRAEDALKMIMVGAVCVQVYTAALLSGPAVFERIATGVSTFLRDAGGGEPVRAILGAAAAALRQPSQVTRRLPLVDTRRCHPCGACARVCPEGAIQVGRVASVVDSACTGCGLCVDVCPPRFAALSLAEPG